MSDRYHVSKQLSDFVKKEEEGVLTLFISAIAIYIFFTTLMWIAPKNFIAFIIGDILLLLYIVYSFYNGIYVKGNNINKVVEDVTISDVITLKTFSYNFLFIKMQPIVIEINKNDFKLLIVECPFKPYTKLIKKDCWTVDNDENKPIIIAEQFNDEFNQWLKSIKKG